MIETEKILEELGLSKNEAKAYLAVLELGSATANTIAKKSGVHRTNVYDSLKRLTERGLVNHISSGNKTTYGAADPEELLNVIKEKEYRLRDVLPELRLTKDMAPQNDVHIYEGIAAVRNLLNHFLELGETRYVYGVPKTASELLSTFFLENYHKRRAQAKLSMKHIYNSDARDRVSYLRAKPLTQVRCLPHKYDSPVATSICKDEVVLTLYSKPPISIQIKSKPIAEAYKRYFDLLWEIAEE